MPTIDDLKRSKKEAEETFKDKVLEPASPTFIEPLTRFAAGFASGSLGFFCMIMLIAVQALPLDKKTKEEFTKFWNKSADLWLDYSREQFSKIPDSFIGLIAKLPGFKEVERPTIKSQEGPEPVLTTRKQRKAKEKVMRVGDEGELVENIRFGLNAHGGDDGASNIPGTSPSPISAESVSGYNQNLVQNLK
ncbi:MAG: hypothetical protein K0R25_682 [Rickettsiaceae bacterium]|jgi:hypothetical protein|nr:hypothetical protein [Rickettsiaceae bacterium]